MKNGSNHRAITGLLLVVFVGAVVAADVLTDDKSFSEEENRVLEERPDFSLNSLVEGEFVSEYEQYTSDQFAFRNAWIGVKTDADRALGKKESNGVFLGENGHLMEHYTSPSEAVMQERVQAIQTFHEATSDLPMYVMVAPTIAGVLPNKLPAFAPIGDQQNDLIRLRQRLPEEIRFVDVFNALAGKQEELMYYKTDHHWTTTGAYYAYRALCLEMGIVPQDKTSFDILQATDEFYGSLYSKSGFRHLEPDNIHLYLPKKQSTIKVNYVEEGRVSDSLYEPDHLRTKDKYAVFLDGNHPLVRITTDSPEDKKILVIKDSYANSLLPFLTEHFSEINVVDPRYYDKSLLALIEERQIDSTLFLYNMKTFFEDSSIMNITEGLQ
ncbi:DHHW family protein [Aureibacillus halotolerans]|uniref:DHHW motif protein n=1 Tax=Aureibacillus halotolerans TaxID=1508390 RepID=A0A4R6TT51_9BACI|nr:DHHW family protein [Aureibacillus halotolerans]TDQ33771.1 DHHW motif protein [Aureibacillus halotolerans]